MKNDRNGDDSVEKMNMFGETKEDKKPAFGIDLGTTNSAISVIKEGNIPDIITLDNGRVTLPSCVAWLGGDKFLVGKEAYEHRYLDNTIYSVKRLMGSGENIVLKYQDQTKTMTPAEVSAEILKELCRQASKTYGEIKDVVITVPAYFNNLQLEDTRKAGELAGLNVLSTLREPTSASLVYNLNKKEKKDEMCLVYDLGGGTFDISLVKIGVNEPCPELDKIYGFVHNGKSESSLGEVLTVVKNEGDMHLGGDDIDTELYKIFEKRMIEVGLPVDKFTRASKEKIILDLERLKKSNRDTLHKYSVYVSVDCTDDSHIEQYVDLYPEDFMNSTKVIYGKTKHLVDNVLNGVNPEDISSIVLVGGSTKSIIIKELLKRDFPGITINDSLNPDESVALGAGVQAKRLKFGNANVGVFDILPLAIGVLADDMITKVIMKNQVVPYSATRIYSTTSPNQTRIRISIYQGNSSLKEECTKLGDMVIDNIPKNARGKCTAIKVRLSVNAEGILSCYANVAGRENKIVLTNLLTGDRNVKQEETNLGDRQLKKLRRWRRYAKRLDGEHNVELNKLLDIYEKDESIEDKIISFIESTKTKVNNLK